ncbi:hypothetical protein MSMTP_1498 [Methanosarcina sp. MTP4]|uniref:hypothetical protein n=1 Tax=Methanosarcina sp. MTP4 TaxID=1434100 RepID=UPI0006157182|nr:hypothetical protein [Methanosarcina sp. MTP4]AKB24967.1 hypothetical protein MSMTP_1498 [Methanosarcina sp. MTP4]
MPTKEELESQIMDFWDEIFTLEDKRKEELDIKYAEWRKVEPRLDEGGDEFVAHIESMEGISDESLLIYKDVKEIKARYKQEMDKISAKIDALNKEKEMM